MRDEELRGWRGVWEAYAELLRLVGRRVCAVEDWHVSKWRIVQEEDGKFRLEPRLTEDRSTR